jgi:hypothetical protein
VGVHTWLAGYVLSIRLDAIVTPLQSSNLHAVGTDGADLLVQFKGKDMGPGQTYRYKGAAEHYYSLMGASSAGSYHHQNVKGKYPSNKEQRGS